MRFVSQLQAGSWLIDPTVISTAEGSPYSLPVLWLSTKPQLLGCPLIPFWLLALPVGVLCGFWLACRRRSLDEPSALLVVAIALLGAIATDKAHAPIVVKP